MTFTPASVTRLALLALFGGIVQLSAVSQITVFGVPADLTPGSAATRSQSWR